MQTPLLTPRNNQIKILWVTDPWLTLDYSKDTTLRLMLEAINMGIPTYWSASDQLLSTKTPGKILAVEITKDLKDFDFSTLILTQFSVSNFQQIHFRVDPPVDEQYCKLIDDLILAGAHASQILNPPLLIKNQSEKIPPTDLALYTPRLKTIKDQSEIQDLEKMFAHDQEIVSKPLHLAQSIGVKKHPTPKNRAEWQNLITELTLNYTQEILIEEYLPEINQGEVRMWFSGKKFIAALKKFPKTGDFRVLIDEGSRITPHTLTKDEEIIAEAIGNSLHKQGILLAAIDLIGNKICDYNITSPGLLVQLEAVHDGKNFAKDVLIQALQFPAQRDHE